MVSSTRILSDKFQGKTVHRLDTNGNHKPDADEPMIVRKGPDDQWKPAEHIDRPIQRFAVEKEFGFWTDKQVSHKEGWFWNKTEVVDRPVDGAIQADEVNTTGFERLGNGLYGTSNAFVLGAEILKDSDGALFLDEHFQHFPSRRIIGEGDISRMKEYRADDANWQVNKNTPTLIGVAEGPFTIGSGSTTITVPLQGKL